MNEEKKTPGVLRRTFGSRNVIAGLTVLGVVAALAQGCAGDAAEAPKVSSADRAPAVNRFLLARAAASAPSPEHK